MEIPVVDDPAVEKPRVVIVTSGTPAVVVEKKCSHRRLLGATTMVHLNFSGGPDRDPRQGGLDATTIDGPRDGSGRVGEIPVMIIGDATMECPVLEVKNNGTTTKLRCINKSPGASR